MLSFLQHRIQKKLNRPSSRKDSQEKPDDDKPDASYGVPIIRFKILHVKIYAFVIIYRKQFI
jgi:hypothetical protein